MRWSNSSECVLFDHSLITNSNLVKLGVSDMVGVSKSICDILVSSCFYEIPSRSVVRFLRNLLPFSFDIRFFRYEFIIHLLYIPFEYIMQIVIIIMNDIRTNCEYYEFSINLHHVGNFTPKRFFDRFVY